MKYKINLTNKAEKQYHKITQNKPKLKNQINQAITALSNFQGDIKKLKDRQNEYRLRINNYRLIFTIKSDIIYILDINDRKEIYRKEK